MVSAVVYYLILKEKMRMYYNLECITITNVVDNHECS